MRVQQCVRFARYARSLSTNISQPLKSYTVEHKMLAQLKLNEKY